MTSETAFYRATPQFVIELLASGTAIERSDVATKMTNYMNYGVDLSWVVDPFNKSVTVYRRKRGGGYEVRSFSSSFELTRFLLRWKLSTIRPPCLAKTSSQTSR
mmetsp:Transcript_25598/g.82889  ORF Transcript_25598/g.82889 Transcript_25598/m.82889 type:complete len:104 (-) Transcript_25598:475-786(-)